MQGDKGVGGMSCDCCRQRSEIMEVLYAKDAAIRHLEAKLDIAVEALDEIRNGTHMTPEEFMSERVKSPFANHLDTIQIISRKALAKIKEMG